jgi:hypothetical protein
MDDLLRLILLLALPVAAALLQQRRPADTADPDRSRDGSRH